MSVNKALLITMKKILENQRSILLNIGDNKK